MATAPTTTTVPHVGLQYHQAEKAASTAWHHLSVRLAAAHLSRFVPWAVAAVLVAVALAVMAAVGRWRLRLRDAQKRRVLEAAGDVLGKDVALGNWVRGGPPIRWVGGQVETVRLKFSGDAHEDKQARLERAFRRVFDGEVILDWGHTRGTVKISRRPPKPVIPSTVAHPAVRPKPYVLPLGVSGTGPVVWDLDNPARANAYVVGTTGSGKSSWLACVIAAATALGCEVWIVDGKGDSFVGFASWPGVTRFQSTDHEQMIALLEAAHAERERRSARIASLAARRESFPHLIVIVDEAGLLIEHTSKEADRIRTVLKNLARGVRSVRMHLVVGVHQPNAKLLGGTETRELFGVRVALGKMNQQSRDMIGAPESPPAGPPGRSLTFMANGVDWEETQTYWVPTDPDPADLKDRDVLAVLRALAAAEWPSPSSLPAESHPSPPCPAPTLVPRLAPMSETANDAHKEPYIRQPGRNGRAMSPAKIAELQAAYDEGLSFPEIAKRCGVGVSTAHRYVVKKPARLHLLSDEG